MNKLPRVDTYLGPEMKSTGEVDGRRLDVRRRDGQGADRRRSDAAAEGDDPGHRRRPRQARRGALLTTLVAQGYEVIATEGTAETMRAFGLPVARVVNKIGGHHPTCSDVIREARCRPC